MQLTDNKINIFPSQQSRQARNSNLELYRIVVMLLIVAHHYICNSSAFSTLCELPFSPTSLMLFIFGGWGKTGINCFVLITGYFMCTSSFSLKKLLKLYLQIAFYGLVIYGIFCVSSHENFSIKQIVARIFPISSITNNFTDCFLLFYLFIPFLNILVHHLTRRQHALLLILLVFIYCVLPSTPFIKISFNYIEWFIVLYVISSFLRFYGKDLKISHTQWGMLSLISVVLSSVSIALLLYLWKRGYMQQGFYYLVTDSNKPLPLLTAVTSFMWFKDIRMKHNSFINAIGACTFGVLLIHANSSAMRQWLWEEMVETSNHIFPEWAPSIGYAVISVLLVFSICSLIEYLRLTLVETWLITKVENLIKNFFPLFRNRISNPI